MAKFRYKASDDFFPETFEGEIEATCIQEAIYEIKATYAHELDTDMNSINVEILHETFRINETWKGGKNHEKIPV